MPVAGYATFANKETLKTHIVTARPDFMRVEGINLEGYILKYFIFEVLYILKYCVICFNCL